MSKWVTRLGAVVLPVCALLVTGMMVRREFFPAVGPTTITPGNDVAVSDWERVVAGTYHASGPQSTDTLVIFNDFQCPACRGFATSSLPAIRTGFGERLTVIFRHWPLEYHKLAYPAARATECAGQQGRYEAYHDALFASQDSIGVISFIGFAQRAAVPDTVAFAACLADTAPHPQIEADRALARAIGARGTPAIVLNGMLLGSIPDSAAFGRLLRQYRPKS